jgi:hypothetical protein
MEDGAGMINEALTSFFGRRRMGSELWDLLELGIF